MSQPCATSEVSLCRELASRPDAVDAVCAELRTFLQVAGCNADLFAVELVAREALNNAVSHGNQNQPEKKVGLEVRLGRRWLRLQVADQGDGFNRRAARLRAAEPLDTRGRGLLIFSEYADRVAFNRRGNQITLWMDIRNSARRYQNGKLHA